MPRFPDQPRDTLDLLHSVLGHELSELHHLITEADQPNWKWVTLLLLAEMRPREFKRAVDQLNLALHISSAFDDLRTVICQRLEAESKAEDEEYERYNRAETARVSKREQS